MSRRRVSSAGAVLGWATLVFVLSQVLFTGVLDGLFPLVYDPESEARFSLLRKQLAEHPDRPLLLALGSSRVVMNFRPEILPPLTTPSGNQALVFNFSHYGGNHTMQLMQLRRLLRQGIRPRWLIVELMVPMLSEDSEAVAMNSASLWDLPTAQRHLPRKRLYGVFVRNRILPWYKERSLLLHYTAPGWIQQGNRLLRDQIKLDPLGGDSGWMVTAEASPQQIRYWTDCTRRAYEPQLQKFQVKEKLLQPVRDLVALCRHEHIEIVLLTTPESKEFQSWYASGAEVELEQCCQRLRHEFGVPIVNARDWIPTEGFMDGHHAIRCGGDIFTRRLEKEVLRPLVAGSVPGN